MTNTDALFYQHKQAVQNARNNELENQRVLSANNSRLEAAQKIVDENVKLRLELSKQAEQIKELTAKIDEQNKTINSLNQPKWHQWLTWFLSGVAAIGAILSCFI